MVIYLDFDGVTHPISGWVELFTRMAELEKLILSLEEKGLDVKIVLSTDWQGDHSLEEAKTLLSPLVASKVIGGTYYDLAEIDWDKLRFPFIEEDAKKRGLEIEEIVIIDDNLGLFPEFEYFLKKFSNIIEKYEFVEDKLEKVEHFQDVLNNPDYYQRWSERFILTNGAVGFSEKDIEKILNLEFKK